MEKYYIELVIDNRFYFYEFEELESYLNFCKTAKQFSKLPYETWRVRKEYVEKSDYYTKINK